MSTVHNRVNADTIRRRAKLVEADIPLVEKFIDMVKDGCSLFSESGNSNRWRKMGVIAYWNETSEDGKHSIDWELTVRTTWSGMLRTVTTRIEERRTTHGDHACRTYDSAATVI